MTDDKIERNLPAVPAAYTIAYRAPEPEPEEPSVPLSHYLWILRRHRWKILGFVAASLGATLIVSSRVTPIYEATATVDIDRRMPTGIIGQESVQSTLNDADQFLATQIKLVQSDSVLRPVVEKYKLEEEPDAFARQHPERAEEAPVLLKRLKVTRPVNTYLLLISYRSPDPRLAAEVANAVAQSYIEHTYNIRYRASTSLSSFMEKQLEELRAKMERSSAALAQFERELNVINPEEKTNILSARLLQLNQEYTAAQADRVRKEAAYNAVRSGALAAAQASSQGEALRKLSERLDEAREKFAEVKVHYGPNHPEHRRALAQLSEIERLLEAAKRNIAERVEIEYRQAVNRELMLKQEVAATKAEFDRLNARSFEYQALKREAEADKKLYEELVQRIKEAGINAGFQNSSIRIADPARPPLRPVFPNLKLNLVLAFLFSSLLAIGAAVASDVLDDTVRDPEQVSRLLKTEVVGSLPLVRPWRGRLGPGSGNGGGKALVRVSPTSTAALTGFEEAIRTLRNSILLADFDRRLRSLMMTSASPAEGKTTTAVHLAMAHAQQRQRTLLLDCDLRRPGVHRALGLDNSAGLSNVLLAGGGWREHLRRPGCLEHLDVLPAGPPSRRAADLLGQLLPRILEEASADYDLVIVDAPPLLGFPEPLHMATLVDGVVLVALAGETNRKALHSAISTLTRLKANVVGLVLNAVSKELGDSYHYYGYYGKYYRYYHRDGKESG